MIPQLKYCFESGSPQSYFSILLILSGLSNQIYVIPHFENTLWHLDKKDCHKDLIIQKMAALVGHVSWIFQPYRALITNFQITCSFFPCWIIIFTEKALITVTNHFYFVGMAMGPMHKPKTFLELMTILVFSFVVKQLLKQATW